MIRVYRFPPRLHKASTERTNAYKCFAEDYQTEHRRRAFKRANAYKCFAEDYQTEHRKQAFSRPKSWGRSKPLVEWSHNSPLN
ncbi:hypothetical protein PROFUN_16488 [Planoprotostelium fungivorum]|uniref:Uncharacterized protein n=1 Tax=Planoprotostelium fungivorum TaxID=1890364 RepID=A0A2P6MQM2_9EUKA|nr:hypothetical protein PROFUN_16488 [Planoprotostelium fungivorum]